MAKISETQYLAAIAACSKLTPLEIKKVLSVFGNGRAIWQASESQLKSKNIPGSIINILSKWRTGFNFDTFWEKVKYNKLRVISLNDNNYPQLLKEMADPPIVIYIKGHLESDSVNISIVGNRQASEYGYRMTQRLVRPLVYAGATIISGLALGIDGAAHRATLEYGGKTVAVLAHGLDMVYPASHIYLAKKILETGGALISEFPPDILPLRHHFLLRNRIIAGLSMGTVIVEAGEKSGALTTARVALEEGRMVFAVPGDSERPQSIGVNNLIKQGAYPVTKGEEILEGLNLTAEPVKSANFRLSKEEDQIFENITTEPIHIDKLAAIIKINMAKLNEILINLELKGLIKNVGGMRFIRT